MFKLKMKLGVKKCFKIIGIGKVVYVQVGKCYGMIKWLNKQICNLCGIIIMFEGDVYNVKKYFLFNG